MARGKKVQNVQREVAQPQDLNPMEKVEAHLASTVNQLESASIAIAQGYAPVIEYHTSGRATMDRLSHLLSSSTQEIAPAVDANLDGLQGRLQIVQQGLEQNLADGDTARQNFAEFVERRQLAAQQIASEAPQLSAGEDPMDSGYAQLGAGADDDSDYAIDADIDAAGEE